VVDDGSTDGGAEAVARWFAAQRGRIDCKLIVQANAGVSAARNRGVALAADCRYLAFVDSDDVWPRDFLRRCLAALDAQPQAVAVTCDRRIVAADGSTDQRQSSAGVVHQPALWMLEHGANIASASVFRASAIQRHGGFNPALRTGEDSALFMPLSLDGPWLHAPGEPVAMHRGRAARLGEEGNLSAHFRDNRRIWARIYEEFFARGGGRSLLGNHQCRRLLARAWFQAAQELLSQDCPREALACLRKSIGWNPWRSRYQSWAIRAWWRSVTGSLRAQVR
jgi:glycosyltransferase involved in cell wall biosynthesis